MSHTLLGTERQERVFMASGSEQTRTVVVNVRLEVPLWATAEDAIAEYVRWLDEDPEDAIPNSRVIWEDTGEDLPEAVRDDTP